MPIAEFLVGNLDERGFLECSVEEVARILEVSVAEVRAVLMELQAQEPVGIGSRDLKECLLLQLDYLEARGTTAPPRAGDHRAPPGAAGGAQVRPHRPGAAHPQRRGDGAAQFIKKHLNPFPAQGTPAMTSGSPGYVLPDVIIAKRDKGFEVDVVESKRFFLRINPLYRELMLRAQQEEAHLNDNERHIQQYVSRARLFMANIDQRRQTLQRIVAYLVSFQGDYLANGVRHLRPLTRAMVAAELGVHESTVSRATASKYVMLPTGEVVP